MKIMIVLVLVLVSSVILIAGDPAKDREECGEELAGLATCLPYVGGKARAPTPDCCTGLKTLMKNNKKCLCVIVRDRNDPDLGLQINVTLALSLPSICHSPANVSKCPELLKMDPKSAEAQVFYQLESGGETNHTAPAAPSPASNHTGHVAGSGSTSTNDKNGSTKKGLGLSVAITTAIIALNFTLML